MWGEKKNQEDQKLSDVQQLAKEAKGDADVLVSDEGVSLCSVGRLPWCRCVSAACGAEKQYGKEPVTTASIFLHNIDSTGHLLMEED
jgi:hypothetical protein